MYEKKGEYKMIPWNNPTFGKKELQLVSKVLKTGYVSEGPMTRELEVQLSKIVNAKHIILTTSATAALYLSIEADKRIKGYTKGTVVIPNLTFLATKQAVDLANLNIEYCDVDKEAFLMDGNWKNNVPRIILNVNLLGRNNAWEAKGKLNPTVICDNAGCLGSKVDNGKVGCYSLQANKLLTCGQGGFCATDDDEYAKIIRQIKDFGRTHKDQQNTLGFNFKFNDIQAAVALGQLQQFKKRKRLHITQYNTYKKELSNYGKFVNFGEGEIPLWVEFLPLGSPTTVSRLYDYLKSKGIECRRPWEPLVPNPRKYPNTFFYTCMCLWLPNGSSLKHKDLKRVIATIKEFYNDN